MRGYRIVETDGAWHFELIPNNTNAFPVGRSRDFDSNLACAQAVRQFRNLVRDNLVNTADSPFVRLTQDHLGGMRAEYLLDGEMIFATRYYRSAYPRQACRNSVVSIFRHIDGYTQRQVD